MFKLCRRRPGLRASRQLSYSTYRLSDDVMQALIRDINWRGANIEMVFYIWQPGGMADQVAESLMAAARRGITAGLCWTPRVASLSSAATGGHDVTYGIVVVER